MKKTFLPIMLAVLAFSCKKDNKPSANFTIDKSSYFLTQPVAITNTSKNGDSFNWDFGDGTTSTDKTPTYAYETAGTYKIKLSIGGSVSTKTVKVNPGTAAYVVFNNTSTDNLHLITFFYETGNTDVLDPVDHGFLNKKTKTDTAYTSRAKLYLGGQIGTSTFTVVDAYIIAKFTTKIIELDDSTVVYVTPAAPASTKNIIQSLRPAKAQGTTTTIGNLIKRERAAN